MSKYEYIDSQKNDPAQTNPVTKMRAWLAVSTSGFYHWLSRPQSALAARLDDIDRDARSEALVGLAYCHDPRARPRVRAALSRPSGDVWRLEIVAAGALSDPTLHELVQRHQDGWSTVADATTADARPASRTYGRVTCRAGLGGFKGSDVLRPDHI